MAWDYNRCISVLTEQITLLKRMVEIQESIRKAVMDRIWSDFDVKMNQINQMGEEFALLEAERAEIFASLRSIYSKNTSDSESSFYNLASKLPPAENRELSRLYRELKMETLKMKALNESFMNYLKEIKTVAAAWLDAVFPAQGGKLYTQKGRQAARDVRSMIVSRKI